MAKKKTSAKKGAEKNKKTSTTSSETGNSSIESGKSPNKKTELIKDSSPGDKKPAIHSPSFELKLGLQLDQTFDRVIEKALKSAGKAVSRQVTELLKISGEIEGKERREMERARRKIGKAIEKAIGSSILRLLDVSKTTFTELSISPDGGRAVAPAQKLDASGSIRNKLIANYRELPAMINGDSPLLKKFKLKNEEIVMNFGDSVQDDHYLSGSLHIVPNYENPTTSMVRQELHLFSKRGKSMGMQLKIEFAHDLVAKQFQGQLQMEVPLVPSEE